MQAKSGHLGLPLGCAEIGAILWGNQLKYNPSDPRWLNRDRFVLSAGHGSMFLYAWLHLSGYALPLQEIKCFRQLHSLTPGHPESPTTSHVTPGVEATTGPLGTGFGNAVGMAAAAKAAGTQYNTDKYKIIDHYVIVLCGDGCLQEGVSFEAAAFAAHEKLDNLIVIYDKNGVTLDQMAAFTQSEDHEMRFRAMGWNTITIDGHNLHAIDEALSRAKHCRNGKPTIIIATTTIGKGISEVEGTTSAHGESGLEFQAAARLRLNLPNETFYVSPETQSFFAQRNLELKESYNQWQSKFEMWKDENPLLAKELEAVLNRHVSAMNIIESVPPYNDTKAVATRQSAADILQHVAKLVPYYISGSADLHSSTKNYISHGGDFGVGSKKTYKGRNFYFGIREHGMGAIMNGIAQYGLHIPSGSTFLAFSDYLRPTIRIAALSELHVNYIFTHDSIAVGEDGPTHQPVETLSSLRIIPNLDVIRPADPEEVVGAFASAVSRTSGPTALILSRQTVPTINHVPVKLRREGVLRGAYIIRNESGGNLDGIIIATGSEVSLALAAAEELGSTVRVVSMPCAELFDRQSADYKESVLPRLCVKRVAVEAGVTDGWYKYVGFQGTVIGVNRFGASAPGDVLMKHYGMTVDNIVSSFREM